MRNIYPQILKYGDCDSINKLCKLYGVDYKTMMYWLHPIMYKIKPGMYFDSRGLSYDQVNTIMQYLGFPFPSKDEIGLHGLDFTKCNTRTALAKLYGVNRKTFSIWIERFWGDLGENLELRYKFYAKEQRIVFEKIGPPDPKRFDLLNPEIKPNKVSKKKPEVENIAIKSNKSDKKPDKNVSIRKKLAKRFGFMGRVKGFLRSSM